MEKTILLLVVCCSSVAGLFPTVCVNNVTTSGMCCPAPEGFAEPCGGVGRGSCRAFPDDVNGVPEDERPLWGVMSDDDRLHWPTKFIKKGCHCEGNFYGFDCSQCYYGYTGDNCDQKRPTYVRPNILTLMKDENRRKTFIDTLVQSKHEPSGWSAMKLTDEVDAVTRTEDLTFYPVSVYDLYIFRHVYAARSTKMADGNCLKWPTSSTGHAVDMGHFGPGFLPWHRRWGLGLEQDLQRISGDPTLALPYWDWVDNEGSNCPFCTEDFMGETDPNDPQHRLLNSPFADWHVVCPPSNEKGCDICDPTEDVGRISRTHGGDPMFPSTPDQSQLDYTMARPVYDTPPHNGHGLNSFCAVVDGSFQFVPGHHSMTMHAQIHLWFNGTMSEAFTTAANDPVFILHHNFVDKLWETWTAEHDPNMEFYPGKEAPIGHGANDWLVPFYPPERPIDMVKRIRDLGYTYEGMENNV